VWALVVNRDESKQAIAYFFSLLGSLMPSSLIRQPDQSARRKDAMAREVVQRNAKGSVRLAQGAYLTEQQSDQNFQALKETTF
jgi:hypothetical protein